MSDDRRVSGAVTIDHDSDARVAFELMKFMRNAEPQRQDETLELFARCLLTIESPYKSVEEIK